MIVRYIIIVFIVIVILIVIVLFVVKFLFIVFVINLCIKYYVLKILNGIVWLVKIFMIFILFVGGVFWMLFDWLENY